MISFRYHLVSIIAVFLALALGIVVGTTALNGPITKDLRHQVDALKSDRKSLSGQVAALQGQVGNAEKFAALYGGQIVKGSLTGQNVLHPRPSRRLGRDQGRPGQGGGRGRRCGDRTRPADR